MHFGTVTLVFALFLVNAFCVPTLANRGIGEMVDQLW